MENKAIFRFDPGSFHGLHCFIGGIFLWDIDEMDLLLEYCSKGAFIDFGEIDGKNSEVEWTIEPNEITTITTGTLEIDVFEKLQLSTGYNPFQHPFVYKDEYYEDFGDFLEKVER